ncbi:ABC-type protease/lipase transport system fused ATPase/permease subunit [Bradyrhizobium elkanii]|nr:ABC-type protease/lipase transport system fused ATPase/permease subunit [Bradyrhizobium elkanii]
MIGALLLVLLTLVTDRLTRAHTRDITGRVAQRNALAEASRRNAEVLHAMGMRGRLAARWAAANDGYMASQRRAADIAGGFGSASKVLRMALQSAVLGVGGYLVIRQEASGGIIIAGAILTSRALAPVELAIAHWKSLVAARQSWKRLQQYWAQLPDDLEKTPLPPPCKSLAVETVSVAPPGDQRAVVLEVSFTLQPGQGLGIVGPSAAGKSSLVRALVGVWPSLGGKVRLDGAALEQWNSEALGRHIGYLPQDVELFAGRLPRTSNDLIPNPTRRRPSPPRQRPVCMRQSCSCQMATTRRSARPERRSLPGSASVSRSPVRYTAIRSWWFSMSPTPTSIWTATTP